MTLFKSTSAALLAATIAFGAMTPVSAPAFASDEGYEVAPVKNYKKGFKRNRVAHNGHNVSFKNNKKAKYFVIGAAVGIVGVALLNAYNKHHD